MLNVLGAALILGGAYVLAQRLARAVCRHTEELAAYIDLLRFIRAQISCFCRPRAEIFAAFEHPLLRQNGFLDALCRTGAITQAIAESHSLLSEEERGLLRAFDRELGASFLPEQLAACDFYTAQLEERLRQAREAAPVSIKVRRTVTVAGAMMLVLLLL